MGYHFTKCLVCQKVTPLTQDPSETPSLNEENRRAWEANAEFWDAHMGNEGNDFANLLCWPVVRFLLDPQPGQRILDIACGNGLFSRRLAALGTAAIAFDFRQSHRIGAGAHPFLLLAPYFSRH